MRSKSFKEWEGKVMEVTPDGRGALVSWRAPNGGHIRTWSYVDSLVPVRRK